MKNEAENFLDSLNNDDNSFKDNQDPFAPQETVEEKEEGMEDTQKEEKPVPFHKDPKVQRYIEKQIAKSMESKSPVEKEFVRENTDEDDYYVRLIGNDTPEKVAMIREAKARDERMLQMAEERAFGRLSAEQQRVIEEDAKAEEELETSLEDIEENFNVDITSNDPVARKTRVDFLKFVERIAPKNSRGEIIDYPDMQSAFETFQETRKTAPVVSRAKDLSARSMARSTDAPIKPQQDTSWRGVDKVFDKLFS